ncbi:homoserine dehydrogenase [Algihabitans albus]|uniref:homoserine dehydrogenase n=1 Tax=Algihabitans albus TaxID=2164067 RepID=UPI000E5D0B5B|nr:homoserine dehydrogenase [Algihabitans albus]
MTNALKIGVAGLGTVGGGVVRLLSANGDTIAERCGLPIQVAAVSARDRQKDRGFDVSRLRWFDDPVAMAADPEVDLVVELIGGSEGVAKAVVETALTRGASVVTANKALVAHHGTALARLAEDKGVALAYEAAVAGGIPVIKLLREGLAANRIDRVHGILNGTCNYILSTMRETGREFGDVLAEAQDLGYAEADPAFDVDGVDAAHKLAILTALAFGCQVDFDALHVEGIRSISALDMQYAEELGYRIKLLGIAERRDGGVVQRVHPCMIATGTPLAQVDGVFNAVAAQGDFVDRIVAEGRGAGAGPTASSVVADIVDLARGLRLPVFGVPAKRLKQLPTLPMADHIGAYYLRLMVVDRPGVIASIADVLRDEEISVEALLQRGRAPNEAVPVVIATHETVEAKLRRALKQISAQATTLETPQVIRIESL